MPLSATTRRSRLSLSVVLAITASGLGVAAIPPAGAADPPNADWGPLTQLSSYSEDVHLALSDRGNVAVGVWRHTIDGTVEVAAATVAGNVATWGNPIAVSAAGEFGRSPDVALSGDGSRAVVSWQQATAASGQPWTAQARALTVTGTTVTLGTPTALGEASESNSAGETEVKMSGSGERITAAWTRRLASTRQVQARSLTATGTSLTAGPRTTLATGNNNQNLNLALSREGTAAAAIWRADGQVEAAAASITGDTASWGATGTVNTSTTFGNPYPEIELSDDGTVVAASWRQGPQNTEVPVSRSALLAGNTFDWGAVTQLMADGRSSDVVTLGLAADGKTALAVYEDETQPNPLGVVRSRVATIDGKNQSWGAEEGPTSPADVDEMDSALSADGAVGVSVWEGPTSGNDTIYSATLKVTGNTHTWSAAQLITDPARRGVFPKIGLSRGGCRTTALWGVQSDTSGDSRSAVLPCASPTLTAVSPPTGPTAGGTTITITGTGFYPGAQVTVGGERCTPVVVVSATTLTCSTPPGPAGTADVVVTNDDGQVASLPKSFTYVAPSPSPTPTPTPTPSPAPKTALQVTAAGKSALKEGERQRLVKATTNGRFTLTRARCVFQGKTLRGRDAKALCGIDMNAAGQRVRISAAPTCTQALRVEVRLRARKGAAAPKTFTRVWRVSGDAVQCRLPGTG